MKYENFEDLPIWQEVRQFINEIYKLINNTSKIHKDFSLCDQLKRCSYSILLNIAEGFERSSNKEFANFLNIAKGSAGELRCILYISLDNGYISKNEFNNYYEKVKNISTSIANFRKYLIRSYK